MPELLELGKPAPAVEPEKPKPHIEVTERAIRKIRQAFEKQGFNIFPEHLLRQPNAAAGIMDHLDGFES